jgi:hypothetical protein
VNLITASGEELIDEEIALRVQQAVGTSTFRASGSNVDELRKSYSDEAARLASALTDEKYAEISSSSKTHVDQMIADGSFQRHFRGKRLLKLIFGKVGLTNVSYEQFCYSLARHAATQADIRSELEALFNAIDEIVNEQLASLLVEDTEPLSVDVA